MHAAEFERAQETLDELSADGVDTEDLDLAQGLAALRMRPGDLPPGASPKRAAVIATGRAEGLFARAVLQSANPERVGSREYGEEATAELLDLLGAPPERLLDLPWTRLIEAQDRLLARRSAALRRSSTSTSSATWPRAR